MSITEQNEGEMQIEGKILRTLRVYGNLSPSMLHTGIGPGIPSAVWRPVLERLISSGRVIRTETVVADRKYPVLTLKQNEPTLKTV